MSNQSVPWRSRQRGRQTLAMLRRRKDETFKQLLARLDTAIASATIDDVYVDEVNTPRR